MPSILAIDDDRTVLRLIETAFADSGLSLTAVSSAEQGIPLLDKGDVDVLLLDIMLPEMNGMELAKKIRSLDARLPVIFMTSLEASGTAIEAMKLGAYDFCTKPLGIEQIQDVVERALETRRLMKSPVNFEDASALRDVELGDSLVGNSPEMVEVYKQIGRVAGQHVPVLIRGESGTGKELVARAIYHHGERRDACYLAVNCAALSDTLLESELFGHEKGSFTGADRRHIGKFEQCHDGTIFLDEIGDMSPLLQSKVLRLLQEQAFERVGGSKTISTDARIISATNRDLEEMIEEGDFRLDLYHRINAFEIFLPPLRDRGDDISLLTNYIMQRISKKIGKQIDGISSEAMELLKSYDWPGNVRELQSVIRRAILMATGPVLVPDNINIELSPTPTSDTEGSPLQSHESAIEQFVSNQLASGSQSIHADAITMIESVMIRQVLNFTNGNQSKAAERLGITRGSLRTKIRAHGITIEHTVADAG